MARIVPTVPEATFVIVGATHPEVRRRHGETYRTMLQERIRELDLEDHVRFVDAYVEQADLMDWLLASDIFVTPYGSAQQAVSGTLAYALAAGKAIVSTPYEYAQELLADGRGMLTPFDDVGALTDALGLLLGDRAARDGMRRRAWEHARAMVWREVGAQHLAMLGAAAAHGAVDDRRSWMTIPIARPSRPRSPATVAQDVPPVRRHLGRLSDDLGVAQHAVGATRTSTTATARTMWRARWWPTSCMPNGKTAGQWRDRSAVTSPSWTRPSSRVTGASATSGQRMVGGSRRSAPRTATAGPSPRWARPLCERRTMPSRRPGQ